MSIDATKNPPRAMTRELQALEAEHQIRLRAYQLYEERGREDGHERNFLIAISSFARKHRFEQF